MGNTPDFDEALGARIRELRERLNLSAEDLATNARRYGLDWKRNTVGTIERGKRKVSAKELLILPMILSPRTKRGIEGARHRVTLKEILDFEAAVSQDAVLHPSASAKLLAGKVPDDTDVSWPLLQAKIKERYDESTWRTIELGWPTIDKPYINADRYAEVERAANRDTEMKAAARLGVDPLLLSSVAFRCYGRSFSDERNDRTASQAPLGTSVPSRQAIRGRVTRQLLDEVRPILDSLGAGGEG